MDTPYADFGTRLYLLRLAQGMSAATLARAVGCTPSLVFAWEAGRELPALRYMRILARVLRVPESDLAVPTAG